MVGSVPQVLAQATLRDQSGAAPTGPTWRAGYGSGQKGALMAGPAASIELTATEFSQLTTWVRAGTTPQRLVRRARVILGSARGLGSRALARQEQLSRTTVRRWLARFAAERCDGLHDRPRSGRPSYHPAPNAGTGGGAGLRTARRTRRATQSLQPERAVPGSRRSPAGRAGCALAHQPVATVGAGCAAAVALSKLALSARSALSRAGSARARPVRLLVAGPAALARRVRAECR